MPFPTVLIQSVEQSGSVPLWNSVLVRRLSALAVLFSLELGVITVCLDNAQLAGRGGLTGIFRDWGPLILRGVVVFPALFLTFACLRFQVPLAAISGRMAATPIRWGLLAAHALALALFSVLSLALYAGGIPLRPDLLASAWLGSGLCAIGFGAAAFIRPIFWSQIARSTGYLWALALIAALTAALGANVMRLLWLPATRVTFSIVRTLLWPFGSFSSDAATMTIGNSRFSVEIAPTCSGLEGIGLILAFTIVWLVLFRKECRFPQALILLPIGTVIAFLLNSIRIAALILLGSVGFEGVAAGGFHSQAGWIAFNVVALGICLTAREVSWISSTRPARTTALAPPASATSTHVNPTAAWVVPFVAILAAGMASRALSAEFEWLYSLRFFAAAIALWAFRRTYQGLDWSLDWTAPSAGVLVFVIWIGLDHSVRGSMPPQLAIAPAAVTFGWLTLRVLAAVVTVPIAEELAFRGFLLRRFISSDFDAVSLRRFSWLALLASSLIFGLLHGKQWISGSLAGAIYALTVIRRGRLGNAVVAHATTNALLAIDVLVFHHWELW
ncbi:MAG: exosortase E/protease, VPEID-CTERM system [Bryobacteraceae bacterium]|jgi:exosortase E/protease (VPEID-CTERM system)